MASRYQDPVWKAHEELPGVTGQQGSGQSPDGILPHGSKWTERVVRKGPKKANKWMGNQHSSNRPRELISARMSSKISVCT